MKYLYYVVLERLFSHSAINSLGEIYDRVMIYDFAEALERNWVDENGNRDIKTIKAGGFFSCLFSL